MKLKAMQASVVRVWPSSGSDVTHFFGLDVQQSDQKQNQNKTGHRTLTSVAWLCEFWGLGSL